MGQRGEDVLAKRIPEGVRYVGVGVGKRWSRAFMKAAAERSGGYFTQINPDEPISWRAFELYSTLNTPRLLDVKVTTTIHAAYSDSPSPPSSGERHGRRAGVRGEELQHPLTPNPSPPQTVERGESRGPVEFLAYSGSIAQGEELCAIARIPDSGILSPPHPQPRHLRCSPEAGERGEEKPPGSLESVIVPFESVTVTGLLDGQPYRRELKVENVSENAGYLPRTWAKLEIDRLLAADAQKNKPRIVEMSKAMYVMTPFTSLLVLENEEMYKQYKVDRGRKDHWALYDCPPKIPVVHEPDATQLASNAPQAWTKRKPADQVLQTVLVRVPPRFLNWPGREDPFGDKKVVSALYLYGRPYAATHFSGNGTAPWEDVQLQNLSDGFFQATANPFPSNFYSLGGLPAVDTNASFATDLQLANNLGYLQPSRALIVKGTSRIHTRIGGSIPYGDQSLVFFLGGQQNPKTRRQFTTTMSWDMDHPGVTPWAWDDSSWVRSRGTGKININTLSDLEVFQALMDSQFVGSNDGVPFVLPGQNILLDYGTPDPFAYLDSTMVIGGAFVVRTDLEKVVFDTGTLDPLGPLHNFRGRSGTTRVRSLSFPGGLPSSMSPIEVGVPFFFDPLGPLPNFKGRSDATRFRFGIVGEGRANEPSNRRMVELLNTSEDLRLISEDWERIWYTDQPSHLTPERTRGGIEGGETNETSLVFDESSLGNTPFRDHVHYQRALQDELARTIARLEPVAAARVRIVQPEPSPFVRRRSPTTASVQLTLKPGALLNRPQARSIVALVSHSVEGLTTDHVTIVDNLGRLLSGSSSPQILMSDGEECLYGQMIAELSLRYRQGLQLYQRPSFTGDDRIFYDLVSHAPGMNTSQADVLAVLEKEALLPSGGRKSSERMTNSGGLRPPLRQKGDIDPEALRLIERARSSGWRSVTFPSGSLSGGRKPPELAKPPELTEPPESSTIFFNGMGQFAYERVLPLGLRERVVCDGATLRHLYPELGIGARRDFSRWHRAGLFETLPWLLPPALDLARGADLKIAGERTVIIRPRSIGFQPVPTPGSTGFQPVPTPGSTGFQPVPHLEIHLVFAEDGRLAERRLVVMPSGKTLCRETYSADGVVRLLDFNDKELAKVSFDLRAAQTPELNPDTKDLVILPMPLRSFQHQRQAIDAPTWLEKLSPFRRGAPAPRPYEDLGTDEALSLFASACAEENSAEALKIFDHRFHARGQRSLGFYTLLASAGVNLDADQLFLIVPAKPTSKPDPAQALLKPRAKFEQVLLAHPNEPLARYLAYFSNPELRQRGRRDDIREPQDSFIGRLAEFRTLYQHFNSGNAGRFKDVERKEQAFEFIRCHHASVLGWALLGLFQDNLENARAVAELYRPFEKIPSLAYAARYERAFHLHQAGLIGEARELYRELFTRTLAAVVLPPLDRRFRKAFEPVGQPFQADLENGRQAGKPDLPDAWAALVRQGAETLLKDKRRLAVVALAWQCQQLGDAPLAEELTARALDDVAHSRPQRLERLFTTLAAIELFRNGGKPARAAALLQPLLADDRLARLPYLWRLAADLVSGRENKEEAVPYLEKALALEFERLPEVIDLGAVRRDYGALLAHYQKLANAMATLKVEAPADFLPRVVRFADQWRALDRDQGTEVCNAAAKVLKTLGARDLAWDYLTTPVGLRPNEADPWLGLAQGLSAEGEFLLADRAYAAAFEAEPTNAQILWDRAQNLRHAGKAEEARPLFQQLAAGPWQPRFGWLQAQARSLAQGP